MRFPFYKLGSEVMGGRSRVSAMHEFLWPKCWDVCFASSKVEMMWIDCGEVRLEQIERGGDGDVENERSVHENTVQQECKLKVVRK